jgi:hypothetical protein
MSLSRPRRFFLILVPAISALAACGGGAAPPTSPEATATPTVEATPTPTPAADLSGEALALALEVCSRDLAAAGFTDAGAGVFQGAADSLEYQKRDFNAVNQFVVQLTPADIANGIDWQGVIRVTYIERSRQSGGDWGLWADAYRVITLRRLDGAWQRATTRDFAPGPGDWVAADTPLTIENHKHPERAGCGA